VCWSCDVGAIGADLLNFVSCADAHVAWTIRARVALSHQQEGLLGWFFLKSISLRPQLKGECVGAVLLGLLVSIYCCLFVALVRP
jgi:predicted N-acetyltransferase YhbS